MSGGNYSLTSTPNDRFLRNFFKSDFIYSQSFCQKSAEKSWCHCCDTITYTPKSICKRLRSNCEACCGSHMNEIMLCHKLEVIDHLNANILDAVAVIRPHTLQKVIVAIDWGTVRPAAAAIWIKSVIPTNQRSTFLMPLPSYGLIHWKKYSKLVEIQWGTVRSFAAAMWMK